MPDLQQLVAAHREAYFALSILADKFPEGSEDRRLCEETKLVLKGSFNRAFHPESKPTVPQG